MKCRGKLVFGISTLVFLGIPASGSDGIPLVDVGFESREVGPYTSEMVVEDFPTARGGRLYDRGSIVEDDDSNRGRVLMIRYPRGAVGPAKGGAQFVVSLPPSTELWLSYYVKFADGFDFRLGGKLPGLTSGGSKFTGGVQPLHGEGWSARFMWRENGNAVVYMYSVDMPGDWGRDLELGGFQFTPGKWHQIREHIRVNAPEDSNGLLEVWIDDEKLLTRSDIRYRIGEQGLIDSFYFSTFHGGNTPDWGPSHDSVAFFDDFVVGRNLGN